MRLRSLTTVGSDASPSSCDEAVAAPLMPWENTSRTARHSAGNDPATEPSSRTPRPPPYAP